MPTRFRRIHSSRAGAAIVEATVVLAVCLLLLLGMLEMSLALVRHTAMSEASRRIARAGIVRGGRATPPADRWGPATLSLNAADDHPAAAVARTALVTVNPADVRIELSWPDGNNEPARRVRVKVDYLHHPLTPLPGWYDELPLRGVSTMLVAH